MDRGWGGPRVIPCACFAALVLFPTAGQSQIRDLVTTDDGQEVLFSAFCRLPGSPPAASHATTVFRYRRGTWTELASAELAGVDSPRVTGDGRVVAWLPRFPCGGSCGFVLIPRSETVFSGLDPATLRIPKYSIELSRNGRFALFPGFYGVIAAVQELPTGRVWEGLARISVLTTVAGDGTVLGLKTADATGLPAPDGARAVAFWWTGTAGQGDQAFFWDQATGSTRALPGLPEGASSAVISHDGSAAWVATNNNRLLRFDLNDLDKGAFEEVFSAFPYAFGAPAPGSAIQLYGGSPPPGTHVEWAGMELPLIGPDDAFGKPPATDLTVVQIPWEASGEVQPGPAVVRREGHPLVLTLELSLNPAAGPQFNLDPRSSPPHLRAAAGDFSYWIDAEHPARRGETIHTFLTGLGALDRPVATGAPGPSDPPARPLAEVACALMGEDFFNRPWRGVATPFLAYAPGRVGLYRLDVTIPEDWPGGLHNLVCYLPAAGAKTYGLLPIGK